MGGLKKAGETTISGISNALSVPLSTAKELVNKIRSENVGDVLSWANGVLDHSPPWSHGVELIRDQNDPVSGDPWIEYVNRGDTYATTLLFDHKRGTWGVMCIGDLLE